MSSQLAPERLDLDRFEALLGRGRASARRANPAPACAAAREALALWRGPALADLRYEPFAQGEIARLEELRLVALEDRIEADLASRSAGTSSASSRRSSAPIRFASAFAASSCSRCTAPGARRKRSPPIRTPGMRSSRSSGSSRARGCSDLERAILRHEPVLERSAAGTGRAGPGHAGARGAKRSLQRSSSWRTPTRREAPLDPEALARVRARSVEEVSGAVERHGGTVAGVTGGDARRCLRSPHPARGRRAASRPRGRRDARAASSTWSTSSRARGGPGSSCEPGS